MHLGHLHKGWLFERNKRSARFASWVTSPGLVQSAPGWHPPRHSVHGAKVRYQHLAEGTVGAPPGPPAGPSRSGRSLKAAAALPGAAQAKDLTNHNLNGGKRTNPLGASAARLISPLWHRPGPDPGRQREWQQNSHTPDSCLGLRPFGPFFTPYS